jgi:hypothetical protein
LLLFIDALAAVGLELDDSRSNTMFIEHTRGSNPALEQTVQQAVYYHNVDCHIPTDRMRGYVDNAQNDDLWDWYGGGVWELQREALEILSVAKIIEYFGFRLVVRTCPVVRKQTFGETISILVIVKFP